MRIAQISDIHLLKLDGFRPWNYLNKRIAGSANLFILGRARMHSIAVFDTLVADLESEGVDHILCTGDVSNLAFQSEFDYVRGRFLEIGGAERLSVIPGNHDAYVADAAREQRFEKTFADWFPDPASALGPNAYPFVKTLGRVTVIGCSSALPTPFACSYGKLGQDQLARLDRILDDPALEQQLVFLLVHHHLHDTGKPIEGIRGLRDRVALLNRLKRSPVDVVLHGHEHEAHRWTLLAGRRPIRIMSCGTSTRVHAEHRKLARYTIFEIEENRLLETRQKVYSPDRNSFIPEDWR